MTDKPRSGARLTRDVFRVLAGIKRGRRRILACPKCGSTNLRRSGWLDGFLFPTRFLCEHCGYSGYLVVELEDDWEASRHHGSDER